MEWAEKADRVAAICTDCGTHHAARIRPNGEIRVIGTGNGCPCGSTDVRPVQ
jgi:thymidine kinase